MAEKFLVLDVEGNSTVRPYNVGYIIADRYGKIYKKHSFTFPECFWENLNAKQTDECKQMSHKNIKEILADISNKKRKRKYKSLSIDSFYKLLAKEINHYKITKMYAYNVNFDKNALKRLFGERFFDFGLEFRDIITGITYAKLLTKRYINFCRENNYLTAKGNIMTKAEIVYKFLTGKTDFKEEHTGLADVMIEYYILLTAFKSKKKLYWQYIQAWRVIDKFINEKGF